VAYNLSAPLCGGRSFAEPPFPRPRSSKLDSTDYPNLIGKGERISTIAVPTILTSYNWRPGSDRYRRVARFVDDLFSRVDKLQAPGFDAKWKDVNLSAKVPGLERFQAAQEWIDRSNTAQRNERR
jgi:hypothetical protein